MNDVSAERTADPSHPRVAIVTDSTADLDASDARARFIDVVPLFVNFGDVRYKDNIELTRDDFYRKLAAEKVLPTTAQPTPAMFEDAFRPHAQAGRPIVCLTIMSSLSGTLNAANTAAQAFPGAEIHVVDSESVAGGLALLAQHASDVARETGDVQAVLAALAHDRTVLRGFATIPDLSHAVRTGRVSRAQAFIGSLVKIVPVLRIERGKVEEHARVRTFSRAIDSMVDAVAAEANKADGARISVIHSHAGDEAARVIAKLHEKITTTPLLFQVLEAGPVIGTHAGQGAVGIFVIPGS
ncbi:MAG: fatty acid kinase fatty acid binding subunit [Candidatus Eremiobacteraeota bacterium]|jgi:DegV family protein with EDD domain|nr:fatty acid kinase fatty acid binding subunit [Candidatus Eremiobacteraeota bacterium]MEA2720861.1 fatty acid kinase fatty acid binding subunit [Candidatus Eremiobacteraeota bacterium]